MQRVGSRILITALTMLGCAAAAERATAQADVDGRWISGTEIFAITQIGSAVDFTFQSIALSGTISADGHLTVTATVPGCEPSAGVDAQLKADEYLDGLIVCPPFADRFLARRCECVDGNASDGDGCDSECQIEPCFTCSGDPSVCTPLGDGAACDDGSACTFGSTCSAGTCAGGTTGTTLCTDLTGRWRIESSNSFLGFFEFTQDIVQRNEVLEFRSVPTGALGSLGTIDPFTGEFSVSSPVTSPICLAVHGAGLSQTFTGVASVSQPLFIGSGVSYVTTPMLCFSTSTSSTGSRCGGGTLDAGEQCDDGNGDDDDGCSSSCRIEAAAPLSEQLKCYGIRDLRNPAFAPASIALADEFVVNDGAFEAKKPFLFCTPVSVDGSPISDSDAYVTCYKVQGPKLSSSMRPRIQTGDALGTLQLEVKKPRFVCLRSTKSPLP